jgi:alkaline phosphatase D
MDRRSFLMAGVGVGAGRLWPRVPAEIIPIGSSASLFSGRQSAATPAVFPQSVASGDPSPNGIILWTRLSPVATPAGSTAVLTWQVSKTPNFDNVDIVLQGTQTVSGASDFTAKVVLSNPALQPWTLYYYRFGFEGILSNTGRFKTLPSPAANLPVLRIGYVSCQDYSNGYYTALAALAAEPLDYVVHLGDYIYETRAETGVVRVVPPFPSGSPIATTLEDYRHLYRTYRSDASLQRLHENFAVMAIWDDHEFGNDAYQVYLPDQPNPTQPKPEQRQAANQAWSEYAASVSFDPRLSPQNSLQIYRSFRFGTLAELVLTDERLYRDGPPCGLEPLDRYVTSGCAEMHNPARTMLGATQRSWFIDRMLSSGANWKLWGNELMNMSLKILNGPKDIYLGLDSWDGYPAERASLLQTLAGVSNLVAITGDIHSFAAGYMKSSYDSINEPRLGIEFVGGSVTSANFVEAVQSFRGTSTSAPVPPKLLKQAFPSGLFSLLALVMNPELEFFNSDAHGYNVLEMTPEMLTCTMKSVSTIKEPTAAVSTLASFVVPSGQRRIIRN